jgi:hypothetical protein
MSNWWGTPLEQPQWVLDLHNSYEGTRAFICGAGPSLQGQAEYLELLNDELVFTCNRLPQWAECPFIPAYHCITEPQALLHRHQFDCPQWPETQKLAVHWSPTFTKGGLKAVESDGWKWVAKAPDSEQVRRQGFWGMGEELPPIPTGYTSPLTIAQVAAWLGVSEIYFLGIDTTDAGYVFNKDHKRNVHPRTIIGITECFVRARQDFEDAGRRMYDCTPGGLINSLGILEYVPIEDALGVKV